MKAMLLPLTLLIAGCMTTTPDDARFVTYTCEGGPELTVVYWGDTAQIREPGAPNADLQRMRSTSGVLYSSNNRKIRGEGDDVEYTVGRAAPLTCTVKAPQAS